MHLDNWLKQIYEEDVLEKNATGLEKMFDQMSPNDLLDVACGRATIEKVAAKMSLERRESLPAKSFAVPKAKAKKIGVANEIKGEAKGKYPIPDAKHARNAMARVSQHGTPAEKAAVEKKVQSKFPSIGKTASADKLAFVDRLAREVARTHYQVKLAQEEEAKKAEEKKCPECEGKGCEKCKPAEKLAHLIKQAQEPDWYTRQLQAQQAAQESPMLQGGAGAVLGGILGHRLGSMGRMGGGAGALLGAGLGGGVGLLGSHLARRRRAAIAMMGSPEGMGMEKQQEFASPMTKEDEFTTPEAQEKAKVMQQSMQMAKGAAPPVRKKAIAAAGKAISTPGQ